MPRSCALLVLAMFWFVPAAGHALEDPTLAAEARQYLEQVTGRRDTSDVGDAVLLRRAERYARQRLWDEAVAVQESLLGRDPESSAGWYRLARLLWEGPRAGPRASRAAYNAWQFATGDSLRARALFLLGDIEARNRPELALAAWQQALGLEENPAYAERYERLKAARAFQVTGVEVESDSPRPRICLAFNARLRPARQVAYEDYLAIEPAIPFEAVAREDRLCLTGPAHGTEYRITVRPGLPALDGSPLADGARFTARVDDRAPTVGFRGNAYVLPRVGRQVLPLTTVNVDAVKVELLRINDRGLVEQLFHRGLSSGVGGWDIERIAERAGEHLWSGRMDLAGERNRELTTALPIDTILAETRPGLYLVSAVDERQQDRRWVNRAAQWLVISDLGLATFLGEDGLRVFVRSLAGAQPLPGVSLTLVARNNAVLGVVETDADGHARFAPGLLRGSGGNTPQALMAYGEDGDYNFLDLTGPAFDLSDRGVEGRAAPGPVDVYLYSERGVYRPGESVQLMALVRDSRGHALPGLPLTVRVFRPDEAEAQRLTAGDDALGGLHTRVGLPRNARSGTWTVRAYTDPDAAPVGELRFQVEDFVPQTIRLELDAPEVVLGPGIEVPVAVLGEFLYGAPAAGLAAEAEVVLREDPDPYPEFPGYRFGLAQERFDAERHSLEIEPTDDGGATAVTLALEADPQTTRPLAAALRVSLFEPGGRPVNRVLGLPYRTRPFAIGIRPLFGGEALETGARAAFDIIRVLRDGSAGDPGGLEFELVREEYDYFWFHQDGRWDYRTVVRDGEVLSSGRLEAGAMSARVQSGALDWGYYRLEVYDPDSDIASSVRFRVGWFVEPAGADTPDRLQITLDRERYRAGDTARVFIRAPFAGEVLLAVASEHLWSTRNITLPDDRGVTVEIPVEEEWSPGVYLAATAFRPAAAGAERGPGRAVGVAWLGLDPTPRRLDVAMDAPEEIAPRQRLEVPLTVTGAAAGEEIRLTLAAVDEGVLLLTDFPSPDPAAHFLGKRRLGVELRDLYGRLIEPAGTTGTLRSGGDADGRTLDASDVRPARTVALFSGPVAVDAGGRVRVPLELPDFNGELRLMAVAWDRSRVGAVARALKVRDPVLVRAYLPRFLAPADRARVTVTAQNLAAVAGEYRLTVATEGAIEAPPVHRSYRFAGPGGGESDRLELEIAGGAPGIGELVMTVDGPEGYRLERRYEISVRAAQAPVLTRVTGRLAPGGTVTVDPGVLEGLLPGTERLDLSVASRPALDVPGLLDQLDRYPYGCLEQTTSRALPLLYFEAVGAAWDADTGESGTVRARVQEALQRVLALQDYSGGFALWDPLGQPEFWLSAYAMDFLTRAREFGYLVPDGAWRRGLEWLQERVNESGYATHELPALAYGLYVLARAGEARPGDLRYLHDNHLHRVPGRLGPAQLGAALARYGDTARATEAFERARLAVDPEAGARRWRDYGTPLRDLAALVALAVESGQASEQVPEWLAALADRFQARRYTSTQEQAWLLMAAHAVAATDADLELSLDGQPVRGADPLLLTPRPGAVLANTGRNPAWYVQSRVGVPLDPQPAGSEGITLGRTLFTRDGVPAEPGRVGQNELLVALVSVTVESPNARQLLVVDLLPAGFEIENAAIGQAVDLDTAHWLPEPAVTLYEDRRDDRYVAALDVSGRGEFHLAYLVRAVTPGRFTYPAVFAEDMYQPWIHGRGAMGVLEVK